jgi:hypothetical protein
MWVAGLIICWGLHKKEQLRARLAAAGQVGGCYQVPAAQSAELNPALCRLLEQS